MMKSYPSSQANPNKVKEEIKLRFILWHLREKKAVGAMVLVFEIWECGE